MDIHLGPLDCDIKVNEHKTLHAFLTCTVGVLVHMWAREEGEKAQNDGLKFLF